VRHGRYTIVRKIAEGGMAEIFLAKQHGSEGFEKLVVLKRILTAFYADEQFRNMLIDEAHISMSLHHNNIAQILDVGKSDGRFCLVMELVDGWDLGRLFLRGEQAGTTLPPGLGLYVLAEICRALSYAHAKTDSEGRPLGIVHRDVSPHNILISEQGEVKITDFGVAKAMTKRDRTGAGMIKGKIAFMSPEQALGQHIDARADLYAMGILIYLVATGRRPFDGPTDMEVLVRAQSGQYQPPEQVNPNLSPSLSYVIRRAMSFERDQRYQSADELLVDLEAILRTDYGSAGQTALKLWLSALGRRDGEAPISRSVAFAKSGSDSIEGKFVQLGDDDDDQSSQELRRVMGMRSTDATIPAVSLGSGGGRGGHSRQRMTGSEATHLSDLALPLAEVSGPRSSGLRVSDVAINVSDDEPPENMRRSRGGGKLRATMVLILLGAAGAGIWHILKPPATDDQKPALVLPPDAAVAAVPPAAARPEKRREPVRKEPEPALETPPPAAAAAQEPAPTEPAPTEPAPTEPAPTGEIPAAAEPIPGSEPAATEPAPAEAAPNTEPAPRPEPTPQAEPPATAPPTGEGEHAAPAPPPPRKPRPKPLDPYARAREWQKRQQPADNDPGIAPTGP
jgi:serine/threonine protein kinase